MSYHRSPKDSLRADKVDYKGETNRGHRHEIWTCCKLCVSSYCLVLYSFCTIPKKRTYPRYLKGIKINVIKKAIESFKGVSRRNEYLGSVRGIEFYADYCHHPTEIKATIESIKQEYPNKKIYIFFHPDRPKRLTKFAYDFIKTFKKAKKTFIFQFLKEGKEENNAIKSVINRKNIVEFTEEAIKEDFVNKHFEYILQKYPKS